MAYEVFRFCQVLPASGGCDLTGLLSVVGQGPVLLALFCIDDVSCRIGAVLHSYLDQ